MAKQSQATSFAARIRGDQVAIPCVVMRGGTSRGVFFLATDLPEEDSLRDRLILAVFGSPDPRQVDGLGGADPLTSKLAIIDRAGRKDADIDYTFGQVRIAEPIIDYSGNCGNLSAAVGPFAIDAGLVEPREPLTRLRIHNTNTGKVIVAEVPTHGGHPVYEGDCSIAGVPGSAARIMLDFLDSGGSMTGRLLPTGDPRNRLVTPHREFEVSIVDAANPVVFVQAEALAFAGTELPAQIAASEQVLGTLEAIRGAAAQRLGFVDNARDAMTQSPAVPKVAMVTAPKEYVTSDGSSVSAGDVNLVGRIMTMQQPHKAYAVTGAICTAAAAHIPGTIVNEIFRTGKTVGEVTIGHPSGTITVEVVMGVTADGLRLKRAALERTARRIMDGTAYVPHFKLNSEE